MRRSWNHSPAARAPIWRIMAVGAAMGLSATGFGEVLLRLAA